MPPTDATSRDQPISVFLVEDHLMVAESLRRAIEAENDLTVVGMAATGTGAVEGSLRLRPHVVLLDLRLPDLDGNEVATQIHIGVPETKIVMLTGFGDHSDVVRAMEAGCSGFLDKGAPLPQLLDGIRRAHRGEIVLGVEELGQVLSTLTSPTPPSVLTRREEEILGLVADGLGNRAIAERLAISNDTVRTHVQRILTKLEAHSRLEAVAIARRLQIIP